LCIELQSGIPYHSQCHTRVERMFDTLFNILTKLNAENDHFGKQDWPNHLSRIAYVLNNSAKIEDQESARKFLCFPMNPDGIKGRYEARIHQILKSSDDIGPKTSIRVRGQVIKVGDTIRIRKKIAKKVKTIVFGT
uniref:EIF2_C domain-containing protein n=1 Tax=Parastrongyloides trichosuri TaxID=131310 RepID=A0A0N4ZLL0_PARTI